MAKAQVKEEAKKETFFQKEKRLKNRKQDFSISYKKGVFYKYPQRLISYLNQNDIVVRVHKSGSMDDDTQFINVTIEGIVVPDDGMGL